VRLDRDALALRVAHEHRDRHDPTAHVGRPGRAGELALGPQVDHGGDLQGGHETAVTVGQALRTVGPPQPPEPDGAAVDRRVAADVAQVERALERDEAVGSCGIRHGPTLTAVPRSVQARATPESPPGTAGKLRPPGV
jgi:hypothetical protein